jgi:hypothetical protein
VRTTQFHFQGAVSLPTAFAIQDIQGPSVGFVWRVQLVSIRKSLALVLVRGVKRECMLLL